MNRHLAGITFSILILVCTGFNTYAANPQKETVNIKNNMVPGIPVSRAQLMLNHTVRVDMDNFVFDGLKFKVLEYSLVCAPKGAGFPNFTETVKGSELTQKAKDLIKNSRTGDMFLIFNVKVAGPTGNMIIANGPTYIVQ